MKVFTIALICSLCCCFSFGKQHYHPVPTFFHRRHDNGSLVDMRNTDYFQKVLKHQYRYKPLINEYKHSRLSVSPCKNLEDKHVVTVSWSIKGPVSPNDWIGFYCPKDHPHKKPIDYFYVTVSSSWHKRYGEYNVTLFNLRRSCEFRYYQHEKKLLITHSEEIHFRKSGDEPVHGHIAMTSQPGQMRVMWISNTQNTPVVKYGLFKDLLILRAEGSSRTYNASQMCEFPADSTGFIDPGIIHDVLLEYLLPNTQYFYQYGSKDKNFSEIYNFTTPLPAGDSSSHTILTFGDHGVDALLSPGAHETSRALINEMRENNIRMILHNGDISYAMGYAYIWDQWSILVEPYATLVPYMVGVGNHEQDHLHGGSKDPSGAGDGFHPKWGNFGSDSGGECGVPMFYRFHMPENGNSLFWYSYDFGLVHYIMISTEHDFSPNSTQYKWLENNLMNVNRHITPWVVVAGHRPMYMSQDQLDEIEVAVNMQRLFEDLLYKYRVDLCLWGHVHSYERTCKMYKNRCTNDGIVHVITGTAGRAIDEEIFISHPWSLFHSRQFGFGRIHIFNETHLQYDFVSSKDRSTVDSFVLVK